MVTEKKICPTMSRPLQGPNHVFDSEDKMIEANWYPVDGVAWENVFPCQREKCMAWGLRSGGPGRCSLIPEGENE
jgi:hypothetical protein